MPGHYHFLTAICIGILYNVQQGGGVFIATTALTNIRRQKYPARTTVVQHNARLPLNSLYVI
jgi:hypothetical protein